jgi:hypothetical protein
VPRTSITIDPRIEIPLKNGSVRLRLLSDTEWIGDRRVRTIGSNPIRNQWIQEVLVSPHDFMWNL